MVRHGRFNLGRPELAFQKPFPEFWNTLGQNGTAFRPQPPAAWQWTASRLPEREGRQTHHDDLKGKVLRPLCDSPTNHLALFGHEEPVIVETWSRLPFAEPVRADEADMVFGALLQAVNPWTEVFNSLDRALLEDARTTHFKKLASDVFTLAAAWEAHTQRCLKWVDDVIACVHAICSVPRDFLHHVAADAGAV